MRKISFLLIFVLCFAALPVLAHSHLKQSSPSANAALTTTPPEIRLWFTEPVEASFSRIIVRDANGKSIALPNSQVDPTAKTQLFVPLTPLADGLYTVSWRVISAADGHPTEGSFAFGINISMANRSMVDADSLNDAISPANMLIRAFQFVAACMAVGSLGVWCFLWRPLAQSHTSVERVLWGFMGIGWALLGLAAILFLLLQTSITADIALTNTLTYPALRDLLTQTTFGSLWWLRMGLWIVWGVTLFISRQSPERLWTALGLGMASLLAQSLFSHASATQDITPIIADWLHLTATTLWVGGLIGFVIILIVLHQEKDGLTDVTAQLVATFSNYVRVCVAILMVTGVYAAWLHIGSIDALVTTRYGQALIIKLIFFVPLLGIAAINLVWTHRHLQKGAVIWVGRLRGLIGAEITLACGILLAVAVMTSGSPAREIQALREAAAAIPPAFPPYESMIATEALMIHFDITPGVVGENEFRVNLTSLATGEPINDASLMRLRFDNLDQDYGQSELRPTFLSNGTYSISGANLSVAGKWRIRMNIQRPGQFDTVKDFQIVVAAPLLMPTPDLQPPLSAQTLASALTGMALLALGGFMGGWRRQPVLIGGRILAVAALMVGIIFLLNVADTLMPTSR